MELGLLLNFGAERLRFFRATRFENPEAVAYLLYGPNPLLVPVFCFSAARELVLNGAKGCGRAAEK